MVEEDVDVGIERTLAELWRTCLEVDNYRSDVIDVRREIAKQLGSTAQEGDKNIDKELLLCLLAHDPDPEETVRSTALKSIQKLGYASEEELYHTTPKSFFIKRAAKPYWRILFSYYLPELLNVYLKGKNELLNAYVLALIATDAEKGVLDLEYESKVSNFATEMLSNKKGLNPFYVKNTVDILEEKTIKELFEDMDSSEPIKEEIRELSKSEDRYFRRIAAAVLTCMPKDQLEKEDRLLLFYLMCDPDPDVRKQAEYAGEKHGYTTVESLCKDLIGEIGEEELSKQIEEANYMGCRDVRRATVVAYRVLQKVKGTLNNALKSTGVPGDAIGGKKKGGEKVARRIGATQ